MIVCRIEIAPHGLMDRMESVASLEIINDGTSGSLAHGNYDVTLETAGSRRQEGRLVGFDRSLGRVSGRTRRAVLPAYDSRPSPASRHSCRAPAIPTCRH